MKDNVLKDPDFLFTLLAAVMKRTGEGKLEITEEDVLAVDMSEAVALHYDRQNGLIILSFVSAEELAKRNRAADYLKDRLAKTPPQLKLVPELEDDEDE